MAGSSFAVGVGYVSRWFAMEHQGSALGVYGLGNIGQSAAVFLGPLIAAAFGYSGCITAWPSLIVIWAMVLPSLARNAPALPGRKASARWCRPCARAAFLGASAFLFLHVRWLRRLLDLPANLAQRSIWTQAGRCWISHRRVCCPGDSLSSRWWWLSDHIGGSRVLSWILLGIAGFALTFSLAHDACLSRSALGMCGLLGIGNGAVFQLVPRYFPNSAQQLLDWLVRWEEWANSFRLCFWAFSGIGWELSGQVRDISLTAFLVVVAQP